jgi:hypothetical protein
MTAPNIGTRAMQRRTGRIGTVTRLRLDDAGQVQSVELTCIDGSKLITSPAALRPVTLSPSLEAAARSVTDQAKPAQPTLFD